MNTYYILYYMVLPIAEKSFIIWICIYMYVCTYMYIKYTYMCNNVSLFLCVCITLDSIFLKKKLLTKYFPRPLSFSPHQIDFGTREIIIICQQTEHLLVYHLLSNNIIIRIQYSYFFEVLLFCFQGPKSWTWQQSLESLQWYTTGALCL